MRKRQVLAAGGLVILAALGGCFGPSEIPEDDLTQNATYEWDRDAAAAYELSRSSYTGVFNVTNRTTLAIHDRDALGTENPVQIRGLQYRFVNGSVVNATHANLSATIAQRRTTIDLPARDGMVAYTASRSGKAFSTPVVVPGAQSIRLPPGARVGVPLLSQVSPGGYQTTVEDGRQSVRWANESDGTLTVTYYLQRDLLLFSALVVIGATLAVGGTAYYVRKIRRLRRRREEIGVDVHQDDDDPRDRGPPPGMG